VSEATIQLTGSGLTVGTPAYMAPEMYQKSTLTGAVDTYALGVTLYQMLAGELPYNADTPVQFMMAHVNAPVPDVRALRSDLPQGVQMVIERAMAKQPEARYRSTVEMADVLAEAARGQTVAAPPPPPAPPPPAAPEPVATVPAPPSPATPPPPPAQIVVQQPPVRPVPAYKKSYFGKAFLTMVLYVVGFWVVGFVLNLVFLGDAKRDRLQGIPTSSVGCLRFLLWIQIILLFGCILLIALGGLGTLVETIGYY
jgi:hypothetical protein